MTEFNIGDKVTVATRGGAKARIEYGPFDGRDVYVVKMVDEPTDPDATPRTFTALSRVLKPVTKFDVGDEVKGRLTGRTLKILAGPFFRRGGVEWYVVEYPGGVHGKEDAENLLPIEPKPAVKVGDRVRVLKDDPIVSTGEYVGKVGTVLTVGGCARKPLEYRLDLGNGDTWWVEAVELVEDENIYEHNGVTYDLTARYRDRDGDTWEFRRSPEDTGKAQAQMTPIRSHGWSGWELESAVASYGPFTRI